MSSKSRQSRIAAKSEDAGSDPSTIRIELSRRIEPGLRTSRKGAWAPAMGKARNVAGRRIGGLVYVGDPPSWENGCSKSMAYIDPALPVADVGIGDFGCDSPGLVGYSDLDPTFRARYLDWLAGDRSSGAIDASLIMLYFFGLERRFFVDDPADSEKRIIIGEALRLIEIYGFVFVRPGQFNLGAALRRFVEAASIALSEQDGLRPILDKPSAEFPLSHKLAIGLLLNKGERISADLALGWAMSRSAVEVQEIAWQCFHEYRLLFEIRYDEKFPNGLEMEQPQEMLRATYESVSREFAVDIEIRDGEETVPDVTRRYEHVHQLVGLASKVASELHTYVRKSTGMFVRKDRDPHSYLPAVLKQRLYLEKLGTLRQWLSEVASNDGVLPMTTVLERLEGTYPQRAAGNQRLIFAAQALGRIGYGLAPDPRIDFPKPNLKEPVAIFELDKPEEAAVPASDRYLLAVMELALGSFVAFANGEISDQQRQALGERAKMPYYLSPREKRRLDANLARFLKEPPGMRFILGNLEEVEDDWREALLAAMVGAARADGMALSDEVARIELICDTLRIDPGFAYAELHAVSAEGRPSRKADSARAGSSAETATGSGEGGLDASRIASIRSDTERVSSALGAIFDASKFGAQPQAPVEPDLPGLDSKHVALACLLAERERWTEEEIEQLCERFALPAAGALEAINEWAYEVHGEALLDECDGYEIAEGVADKLKRKFEGAGSESAAISGTRSGV